MRPPIILAVIPGVDVTAILLAWIGTVSLAWVAIHGRYLWCQWREDGIKPGQLGIGLWTLFACLVLVAAVGVTRRVLPDVIVLRAVTEFALLGVAVAVTWLAAQLLRMWR